jgi:hypothetical protein
MRFSNRYRNLSIRAILLAAAFCASSWLTGAPADQSKAGAVIMLQADGGAPPPPLLPSRPTKTV